MSKKYKQNNSKRKRRNQIIIRCSDEELEEINRVTKESGLTRTDFILSIIRNGNIVVIKDLQNICIELKRQGINLNQALRFAYQYRDNNELRKAIKNCNDLYEQTKDLYIETESKARKYIKHKEKHSQNNR